jgi:hypothetical protein
MYAIVYLPTASIVYYTRQPKKAAVKYFRAITPTANGLKVLMSNKYEIIYAGKDIIIQPTSPIKFNIKHFFVPKYLLDIVEI